MNIERSSSTAEFEAEHQGRIKCVVWDLDETLWSGTLLEGGSAQVNERTREYIRILDGRGILQSIASRNDHDLAMHHLRQQGLAEFFLYPQIDWHPKSEAIKRIASALNIGRDAIALIDDQEFERAEVAFNLPEVLCLDSSRLDGFLDWAEFNPRFITEDSARRRLLYLSDLQRNHAEEEFSGPNEEFLASLRMVFTIARARDEDLRRAEELTVRTHQLNTTGYTYSYEELKNFLNSPGHRLLIAELEDRFGTYGKIGLSLMECEPQLWKIKLLLMSCRVMPRGVGSIMISHIVESARRAHVRLLSEMKPNDRNRMMYLAYKLAGFREVDRQDGLVILGHDLNQPQPLPHYVTVRIEPGI
jgi:FkbH-like protein